MRVRFSEPFRPLYFLAALGAGGLAVSVFMYLMFLVPHPTHPVPTYEDLEKVLSTGTPAVRALVVAALAAIAVLTLLHLRLVVGTLLEYRRWSRTPDAAGLRTSNAEISLMAVPLTLAMTVNVAFIVTALAVPNLWPAVEPLFVVALVALSLIGGWALAMFGRYLGRILGHSGFDIDDTNHFSQVLPSFAFSMVAVGFAASAGMSRTTATALIGMFGAVFFGLAALLWAAVKVSVSFGMMLRKGMAVEAGPTLWIAIPILTLLGIGLVRVGSGTSRIMLGEELSPVVAFGILGPILAAQLVVGLFGFSVMRRQGYFATFLFGDRRSVASYGLVCPGVALSVLAMFFVHWGLVRTGEVERYSPTHLALLVPVAVVQLVTLWAMLRLNRKLLGAPSAQPAPDRTLQPA